MGEWLLAAAAFVLRMLGGGPRRGARPVRGRRRRLVWVRSPGRAAAAGRRRPALLARVLRRRR